MYVHLIRQHTCSTNKTKIMKTKLNICKGTQELLYFEVNSRFAKTRGNETTFILN